jgi:hypothetical protein
MIRPSIASTDFKYRAASKIYWQAVRTVMSARQPGWLPMPAHSAAKLLHYPYVNTHMHTSTCTTTGEVDVYKGEMMSPFTLLTILERNASGAGRASLIFAVLLSGCILVPWHFAPADDCGTKIKARKSRQWRQICTGQGKKVMFQFNFS